MYSSCREQRFLYILIKWDDLHLLVERREKKKKRKETFNFVKTRKRNVYKNNTFTYVFRKVIFIFAVYYIGT